MIGADSNRPTIEPRSQVRDDPKVAVLGGVGPTVHPRRDLTDALLQQTGVAQEVHQPGQRQVGNVSIDRSLEQEQSDQGVEW